MPSSRRPVPRFSALTLLLVLSVALAPLESRGEIIRWVRGLFSSPAKPKLDLSSVTTLGIGEFTGATGESAAAAAGAQLKNARGLKLLPVVQSRFHLTGSSNAGRITAKLAERSGKELFERTYAAAGMDENINALTDDVIFAITGRRGLASSRIAFVSDVTGTKQIYVCGADGRNIQQVTANRFGAVSPAIAADESAMAFTSYSTGFPTLVVIDMASGMERQMSNTPGVNTGATFSPDGSHLALAMSFVGNPEIFVLHLASSRATCVTDTAGAPCSPSWHPDGERLLFCSNEDSRPQLFVTNITNKEAARLWDNGHSYCTDPEWSPDGKRVAFTARIAGRFTVVVKPYPSGKSQLIQAHAQHPTWSPDGRTIAYVYKNELWAHDIESDTRQCLVRGLGHISEPRWMR